ncbi:MAG: hypothetical protein QOD57_5318 [Actinomycetota bacterium]|jgi:hypothetical protein|nr:hypothetical protein [Actinomycetota bacterium]
MTERKLPRPAGDVVEDGVPATEEVRDEVLRTGDAGVADMPMPDRPLGADSWGITDFEERNGEPLARRLARERPEGRDFATDDGAISDTLSAEEAAMHVTDELRP